MGIPGGCSCDTGRVSDDKLDCAIKAVAAGCQEMLRAEMAPPPYSPLARMGSLRREAALRYRERQARRDAEALDRREWIADVKARLGLVCRGDDLDVCRGLLFGDRERATASLQVEEQIRRREIPFEFEAIARRLGEHLSEGYRFTFGPVAEGESR